MFEELGEKLKILRIKNKLSRKQVAEILGVSVNTIGQHENNLRTPSLSMLIKLAALYKVSLDYLVNTENTTYRYISLEGLSDKQIQAVKTIVEGLRNSTTR